MPANRNASKNIGVARLPSPNPLARIAGISESADNRPSPSRIPVKRAGGRAYFPA